MPFQVVGFSSINAALLVLFFSACQSEVLGNINVSSNMIHTVKN